MNEEITSLVNKGEIKIGSLTAASLVQQRGVAVSAQPSQSQRPSHLNYKPLSFSDPEVGKRLSTTTSPNSPLDNHFHGSQQLNDSVVADSRGDFASSTGAFPGRVSDKDREANGVPSGTQGNIDFKQSYRPQFFAALAANFGSFALGAVLSWTATALPDLRRQGTFGEMGDYQETWIASTALLGAAAACPLVGMSIERFGRRKTMLFLTPLFLAGWALIAVAQNIAMIYTGRFMTGFCGGGFSIAAPVYITETAAVKIRGALASGFDMMLTVGILYIFFIGSYVSWQWQAFACGIIPVAFHALMYFTPESPRFLVERGRQAEASKALCWLRGASNSQQVEPELAQLTASVDESKAQSGSWRDMFTSSVIKPTSIALILMLNQQLSGIDAIMFYTVDIFHAAGSDLNENISAIIVGAVQVMATVTSAAVVDRCGRRFLLMISNIFMVVSLGGLGLFFHLKKLNGNESPEHLGWLPLTSLILYVVSFSVGFGPIPWLMLGELLPPHVKGIASGLVTVARWLLGFTVTIVFKDIMHYLGEDGGYWFFASCCFLGIFYVFFVVPETNGKSLDEIQAYFAKSPGTNGSQQANDEQKKTEEPDTLTKF